MTWRAQATSAAPWLAETFQRAGYATRAYTGGGYVNPEFGFSRGFDVYARIVVRRRESKRFEVAFERDLGLPQALFEDVADLPEELDDRLCR